MRPEKYLPGPQPTTIYKCRTRAEERHRLADASMGLVSVKEMEIARCLGEEAIQEEPMMVDKETSTEVPIGKIKNLITSFKNASDGI